MDSLTRFLYTARMNPTLLILPGWENSGPEHWQSLWLAKYPNSVKVEQADWMHPKKDDWVAALDAAIQKYDEVVLVAHSLGCPLTAHWAKEHPEGVSKIKGAFLVSPFLKVPTELSTFDPLPLDPLPFKSTVVASTTDPWCTIEDAEKIAKAWGAHFVNVGAQGHLNSTAGVGDWPEGQLLLQELMS